MIDLLREDLFSLAEAARRLPSQPHVCTLWRWSLRGVRGVRLKTVVVGGRRYTTASFLSSFVAQLSDPRPVIPTQESAVREQQKARAAELAAAKY